MALRIQPYWLAAACLAVVALLTSPARACETVTQDKADYVVCDAAPGADIRVFWRDDQRERFGSFARLADDLAKKGETLAFAMNAGMYHADYRPVGLYVEKGVELAKLNTRRGPGNFHLLPNGVFFVAAGKPGVLETRQFARLAGKVDYATQSGPMLVIDGKIHPRIHEDGSSRKVRNGVGLCDGKARFAISNDAVTFHDFARLFRDRLRCRNALFLDGSISALYAPDMKRVDSWRPMGPIVGVVRKAK